MITTPIFCAILPSATTIFIYMALFQAIGLYKVVSMPLIRKRQKIRCIRLVKAEVVDIKDHQMVQLLSLQYMNLSMKVKNIE